jgi:hypothetical protein
MEVRSVRLTRALRGIWLGYLFVVIGFFCPMIVVDTVVGGDVGLIMGIVVGLVSLAGMATIDTSLRDFKDLTRRLKELEDVTSPASISGPSLVQPDRTGPSISGNESSDP